MSYACSALISNGEVVDGRLPPTVARLLREWAALLRDALMRNWHLARNEGPLERIGGKVRLVSMVPRQHKRQENGHHNPYDHRLP